MANPQNSNNNRGKYQAKSLEEARNSCSCKNNMHSSDRASLFPEYDELTKLQNTYKIEWIQYNEVASSSSSDEGDVHLSDRVALNKAQDKLRKWQKLHNNKGRLQASSLTKSGSSDPDMRNAPLWDRVVLFVGHDNVRQ